MKCKKCNGVGCPVDAKLNKDGLCNHCVEFIKAPLPRVKVMPYPSTKAEKKYAENMQKLVDYEYAQFKKSKMLKTPFGTLIWSPK